MWIWIARATGRNGCIRFAGFWFGCSYGRIVFCRVGAGCGNGGGFLLRIGGKMGVIGMVAGARADGVPGPSFQLQILL